MSDIPRAVLSEAFQQRLADRTIEVAVFLTFRFDPGFFEKEVLSVFIDIPSQAPEVRLLMLDEALRENVNHVAVYYDRDGLEKGAESAKLDVRRIPIHQNGYFHPKNVLLLLRDEPAEPGGPVARQLLVATMSANLTEAGWWRNVEVCHFEEVATGERCSFRDDLLQLIARIKRVCRAEERHDALDAIHQFINRETSSYEKASAHGMLRPRFYSGGDGVAEWLDRAAGKRLDGSNLEVISPYFDERTAEPLAELIRRFSPREVRVLLPRDDQGVAQCSKEYWSNVAALATTLDDTGVRKVEWGHLPEALVAAGRSEMIVRRTVHAKVYRFFRRSPAYEALFIGSVNLTTAGHSRGGNFETGVLVEVDSGKPGWWLEPDSDSPADFSSESEAEPTVSSRLGVRFFWDTGRAQAFWDDPLPSPRLRIDAGGVPQFELHNLPPLVWTELTAENAAKLKAILGHTSFLGVQADDDPPATILVQEEGMAHKPSLLQTLPIQDILRYWALLTPEQKAAFIEARIRELSPTDLTMISPPVGNVPSIFSTFAGIFQAFSGLQTRLDDALENGRLKQVEHYLFGQKYDSLPALIARAQESVEQDDPVHVYVVALCAKQLLQHIRSSHPEFARERRTDLKHVLEQVEKALAVRKRMELGSPTERRQFLEWFEAWFLKQLPPAPVSP